MKEAIGNFETLSGGDLTLTVDVNRQDDFGKLQSAMKVMVDKRKAVIMDIATASENVAAGSRQLNASSEQLAQGASEQAASAEEASASICTIQVKDAEDNDSVIRGRALIGPGNRHILLKRSGAKYYVELKHGPLVSRHRPSVDVLFRVTVRYAGSNAVGGIMSGMGEDGARSMLEMKQAGTFTIAQDEASCIVIGMPNEAIKLGAVDQIVPLENLGRAVMQACEEHK